MELLTLDRGLKTNTAQVAIYRNKDLTAAFPAATFFSHDLTNKTFMVLKTNFPAEQICLTCPSVEGKPLHSYDLRHLSRCSRRLNNICSCCTLVWMFQETVGLSTQLFTCG